MKKLWLKALVAVALALGLSLAIPSGRVIWARAVMAVGSKPMKMWAFRRVESLGPVAYPAVADLILADDFWPLAADGQSFELSADDEAIFAWIEGQKEQARELDRALLALFSRKLRALGVAPQPGVEKGEQLRRVQRLFEAWRAVPPRPEVLQAALRSEDGARRLGALVWAIVQMESRSEDRGEPPLWPLNADQRDRLIELARSDPWPTNRLLAAVCCLHHAIAEPDHQSIAGFLEALANAGSLAILENPYLFDRLARKESGVDEDAWAGILRAELRAARPGLRVLAAGFLVLWFHQTNDPEVQSVLARNLGPETAPTARLFGFRALRKSGLGFDRALPLILAALDPKALRRFPDLAEDRQFAQAPLSFVAVLCLRDYVRSNDQAVFEALKSGEQTARRALIQACTDLTHIPRVRASLRRFLADDDPEIQAAARRALGER